MRLLLLHPPLLSPAVWRRFAPELSDGGHTAIVPDLAFTRVEDWWSLASQRAVAAAARSTGGTDVLVAHSGAGVLVPAVLEALATQPRPSRPQVVLIDAILPPSSGAVTPSPQFRAFVAGLPQESGRPSTGDGGVLPRWTHWWGAEEFAAEVPDAADRAALEASAPTLPEAFFDVSVPVPSGWEGSAPARHTYLRLSPAYKDDAARALARGWHVDHLPGRHLDVLGRAQDVVRAVIQATIA